MPERKLLPLGDLLTESLMQVPHGKLGAIFYFKTFSLTQQIQLLTLCSLPIKGTFAWKEMVFFTLFPRQICPAESRLRE